MTWSLSDLPDQTGRTFVVTGVTSGLGLETARQLVGVGARVVLAARSTTKLDALQDQLYREHPKADLERLVVDLADLESVRHAGAAAARFGSIDVLVNNAGVMATPESRTVDGLDLQLATNHFGPFLLTGLLLPQLVSSGSGRVVTVSSLMHRLAKSAPLGDPRTPTPGRYQRWGVYAQSKLANLLFTYQLDRSARLEGLPVTALAAHPGYSATHLMSYGQTGRGQGGMATIWNAATRATAQPAAMGALPILMAATADLPGSTYCGPSGVGESRGLPHVVGSSRPSRDPEVQRQLWALSERTVGINYP